MGAQYFTRIARAPVELAREVSLEPVSCVEAYVRPHLYRAVQLTVAVEAFRSP